MTTLTLFSTLVILLLRMIDYGKALAQAERELTVVKRERHQLETRISHLEQIIADLRTEIGASVEPTAAAMPVSPPPSPPVIGFSDTVARALGAAQRMRDDPETQKLIGECLRAAQEFHQAHARPVPGPGA